jgi:chaperonin GroEL
MIIRKALEEPIRQIVENAGAEGSIVVDKVRGKETNYGFNAETLEYGDLVKMGVIDPTKVCRTALENAASIAALLLTTEALIAEKPEKKEATPPMPPGGYGGDMY